MGQAPFACLVPPYSSDADEDFCAAIFFSIPRCFSIALLPKELPRCVPYMQYPHVVFRPPQNYRTRDASAVQSACTPPPIPVHFLSNFRDSCTYESLKRAKYFPLPRPREIV